MEFFEELNQEIERIYPEAVRLNKEEKRKRRYKEIERLKQEIKMFIESNCKRASFLGKIYKIFSSHDRSKIDVIGIFEPFLSHRNKEVYKIFTEEEKSEIRKHFSQTVDHATFEMLLPKNIFFEHVVKEKDRLDYITGIKKFENETITLNNCYFLSEKEEKEILESLKKISKFLFDLYLNEDSKEDIQALKELLKLNQQKAIKGIECNFFEADNLCLKFNKNEVEAQRELRKFYEENREMKDKLRQKLIKAEERFYDFQRLYYLFENEKQKELMKKYKEEIKEAFKEVKKNGDEENVLNYYNKLFKLKHRYSSLQKIETKSKEEEGKKKSEVRITF